MWSPEAKARYAARHLGWTITTEKKADGMFVTRVAELPEFMAAGSTEEEISRHHGESLESFLLSYFADDEVPPLPKHSAPFPWDPEGQKPDGVARISPVPALQSFSAGLVRAPDPVPA